MKISSKETEHSLGCVQDNPVRNARHVKMCESLSVVASLPAKTPQSVTPSTVCIKIEPDDSQSQYVKPAQTSDGSASKTLPALEFEVKSEGADLDVLSGLLTATDTVQTVNMEQHIETVTPSQLLSFVPELKPEIDSDVTQEAISLKSVANLQEELLNMVQQEGFIAGSCLMQSHDVKDSLKGGSAVPSLSHHKNYCKDCPNLPKQQNCKSCSNFHCEKNGSNSLSHQKNCEDSQGLPEQCDFTRIPNLQTPLTICVEELSAVKIESSCSLSPDIDQPENSAQVSTVLSPSLLPLLDGLRSADTLPLQVKDELGDASVSLQCQKEDLLRAPSLSPKPLAASRVDTNWSPHAKAVCSRYGIQLTDAENTQVFSSGAKSLQSSEAELNT